MRLFPLQTRSDGSIPPDMCNPFNRFQQMLMEKETEPVKNPDTKYTYNTRFMIDTTVSLESNGELINDESVVIHPKGTEFILFI